MNTEPAAVIAAMTAARDGALTAAKAGPNSLRTVCICLAGYSVHDEPRAREHLDPVWRPSRTVYRRDLDAALAAVCGAGPGLAVVAGTGSVAFGRSAAGETHRAGGWGYKVGDEGSAFWLGSQAIRKTLQGFDGRAPRGKLFDRVRQRAAVDSALSLERKVYLEQWTPAQFAAYAPLVVESAREGDPTAASLVATAASDLSTAALAVVRTLRLEKAPCGLVGGLWSSGAILRDPFEAMLKEQAPGIQVGPPLISAAEGAALLALSEDNVFLAPQDVQYG